MRNLVVALLEWFLVRQQRFQVFAPRVASQNEEEAEFHLTLIAKALIRFLLYSGDRNVEMHHPNRKIGRGLVQGLVLDTVINCAISMWKGSLPVKKHTIEIFNPCSVREGNSVNLVLRFLFIPGVGTHQILCEIYHAGNRRKLCEATTVIFAKEL